MERKYEVHTVIIKRSISPFTTIYKCPSNMYHNPHGPAYKNVHSGYIEYYQNGKSHNIVGPCITSTFLIVYRINNIIIHRYKIEEYV